MEQNKDYEIGCGHNLIRTYEYVAEVEKFMSICYGEPFADILARLHKEKKTPRDIIFDEIEQKLKLLCKYKFFIYFVYHSLFSISFKETGSKKYVKDTEYITSDGFYNHFEIIIEQEAGFLNESERKIFLENANEIWEPLSKYILAEQ
jgi:hypothetical protein